MSGSDWSADDDGVSDSDEVASAMNIKLVEHLAKQYPPRVTKRRRSPSPEAKTANAGTSSSSGSGTEKTAPVSAPPTKPPRFDLVAMISDALRKGDLTLLPAETTVEALSAKIVEALRASSAGGEVAKAVTCALDDPLNVELRAAVLTGATTPDALIALDEVSLLNPQKRAAHEKARLARLDQHSVEFIEKLSLTKTNIYTCPSCGCNECFANFRSTDFVKWGGDDQTPTLLRCCKCGNSFRS